MVPAGASIHPGWGPLVPCNPRSSPLHHGCPEIKVTRVKGSARVRARVRAKVRVRSTMYREEGVIGQVGNWQMIGAGN